MRFRIEKDRRGLLLRYWNRHHAETAYGFVGLRGPRVEIEFPSDWHEERRAWVRLGCGILSVAFSFPWRKTVPDDGQCSGPTYGFYFFDDSLVLQYGKTHGTRGDPQKHIRMPWAWTHREHKILSEKETHPYCYRLRSGEVQARTATINVESRLWTRYWLPWRLYKRTIDITFDGEVGERTGSWKGGTTGCGYEMLTGETPLQCLRRMESERKFT